MLTKFASLQSILFKLGLAIITLSTLFSFANVTTEFYDTPKFIALIVFIFVMLILSTLKYITEGKIVLTITPLDLPLLLVVIVAFISTFTSNSYYISLLGSAPKVYGSLIGIVAAVLFYYLLVNNLKSVKDIKPFLYTLMGGGMVLSVLALLSYFGIKVLPFAWTQGLNFTPTGSSFSTAAVLVLLIPFTLISIFRSNNPVVKLVHSLILTLFGVVIVLIGTKSVIASAAVAVILTSIFSRSSFRKSGGRGFEHNSSLISLIVPVLVIGIVALFSFVKLPGNLSNNLLYNQAQAFPREVQLGFDTSWNVSISAFRDAPLWGTGPATYLFNFTTYKPVAFNTTPYWNVNFDQPFNEYLLVLATLGAVGLVALLIVTFVYISLALRALSNKSESSVNEHGFDLNQIVANRNDEIKPALAVSGIVFFVILALHVSTLVLFIIGLAILASFFAVNQNFTKTVHIRLGAIKASSADSGFTFDVLPVILIIVMIAFAGVGSYYLVKFVTADIHHRQALVAVANNNAIEAYNQLVKAETFNPYNDLYRTDLAQTNFAIANAIASAKGPTPSSPSGSLTDQDKSNIQQFLQQSIAEGRNSVVISPRSSNNWQILGSIYRQISGVAQNATQFSLDAYGRAIQRDPLNPALRLTVGGIYYSAKNYDMAIRFFTDAINLKPDYANGYYNLSIALRDKGNLQEAQAVAEQLVSILQKDTESQDYKTASQYLSDLKSRISTGSAQQSGISIQEEEEEGLFDKKDLPDVVDIDLPKPQDIASPSAVKK